MTAKNVFSVIDESLLPLPTPIKRHTGEDKKAFDILYEATQEIAEIVYRAIREGQSDNGRGYKKIRAILERIS